MIYTATVTVSPESEKNQSAVKKEIARTLSKTGVQNLPGDAEYVLEKRSVDARHGKIMASFMVTFK